MQLQREARIPVLHVCHSFEEARLVADRMAVMREGQIVQVGTPDELMTAPKDGYVARTLRLENVFIGQGVRQNGALGIKVADLLIPLDVPEQSLQFLVHPWDVSICPGREGPGLFVVEGPLVECTRLGAIVRIRIGGVLPLSAHIPRAQAAAVKPGEKARLGFDPKAVHLMGSGEDVGKERRS
jgi:molybdate/tungstate transport system ATP-binding protein